MLIRHAGASGRCRSVERREHGSCRWGFAKGIQVIDIRRQRGSRGLIARNGFRGQTVGVRCTGRLLTTVILIPVVVGNLGGRRSRVKTNVMVWMKLAARRLVSKWISVVLATGESAGIPARSGRRREVALNIVVRGWDVVLMRDWTIVLDLSDFFRLVSEVNSRNVVSVALAGTAGFELCRLFGDGRSAIVWHVGRIGIN
jgi:hypothetical protein